MGHGNAFTPRSLRDQTLGTRPSVERVLALVDTNDPAFPRIAEALQEMRDAGIALDESAVSIAVRLGRQRHRDGTWEERHATPMRQSIVYYIRRGDLIKIGTTTSPAARFRSLMPDEILAWEKGGRREEAARHEQFHASRVARKSEYFRRDAVLMEHIAAVHEENGPPDVTWPSVATLGSGYVRSKVKIEFPEPKTSERVTVAAGAHRIGAKKGTVQGWVRRGVIEAVGHDASGRPVYFLEHMQFLLERNRRWLNRRPEQIGKSA